MTTTPKAVDGTPPGRTSSPSGPTTTSLQEVQKVKQYFRQHESRIRNLKLMLSLAQGSSSTSSSSFNTNSAIDADTWSALEDRLLMRAEEMKSDAVSLYSTYHRQNPDQYPKSNISDNAIKARLLELRSMPRRTKLLKCITDDMLSMASSGNITNNPYARGGSSSPLGRQITGLAIDIVGGGGSVSTRGGGAASHRGGSSGRGGLGDSVFMSGGGGSSMSSGPKDDIVFRCVSRNGSDRDEIPANEAKVVKISPYLSDVLRQSSLPVNELGLRVVDLDEGDPLWNGIKDMHRVFSADNLLRFTQYSRNPNLLEQKLTLDEKLAKAKDEQHSDWESFVTDIKANKKTHLNRLEERAAEEQNALREEFTSSMEADIEAIKQIYDAHMKRESELLKLAQQRRYDATSRFFEEELYILEGLSVSVETPAVLELTQEANRINAMVDTVLPKEGLPRLLMLADVFRCSDLKTACAREIAKSISSFAVDSQMKSELLRHSTLSEILTKVDDDRLSSMYRMKSRCGFPSDLVKEEYLMRQQSVLAECSSLGTVELMEKWRKMGKDNVWQQTVYSVLESRQKSYKAEASSRSFVVPKNQQRFAEISQSSIEVVHPFQYVTAELRMALRVGEGVRKGFWEVRVPLLAKGSTLVIGFECVANSRVGKIDTLLASTAQQIMSSTIGRQGTGTSSQQASPIKLAAGTRAPINVSTAAASTQPNMSFASAVTAATGGTAASPMSPSTSVAEHWTVDRGDSCLGTLQSPSGGFGCGLSNEGLLYNRGSIEDARVGFNAGDVIGVGIDQLTGTLTFFKNGAQLQLPRNVVAQILGKEEVVPCVTMYGTNYSSLAASLFSTVSDSSKSSSTTTTATGQTKLVKVVCETEHEFTYNVPSGFRPLSAVAKPIVNVTEQNEEK